ncbi:MAG: histidine kinase dimerization/phospho-acceptor domain-containing protein [Ferruginibacter sp.]
MDSESKIAELGMLNMLYEMKNPLTNIRLSLEFLEAGTANDPKEYYSIIKKSALNIESSIRELCKSFNDLGITIHIGSDDLTQI